MHDCLYEPKYFEMPNEKFERYCCEKELYASLEANGLAVKPNHEQQPKWIANIGRVRPQTLGKPRNYRYKMEIETRQGTRDWLLQYEIKPDIEPGRYAIPADQLDEFNRRIIRISVMDRKKNRTGR